MFSRRHTGSSLVFRLIMIPFATFGFWLFTRPTEPREIRPEVRPVTIVRCAICGKAVDRSGMVRKYDDGSQDVIHIGCYRPEKGDPVVKVVR